MRRALLATICIACVLAFGMPTAASQEPDQAASWLGVREVGCDARTASARFYLPPLADGARGRLSWIPSAPDETWLDVSLFDNGFQPGTFLGHGPHPSRSKHQVIEWEGLRPRAVHYYRINARVGSQWYEITRGVFETPDCIWVSRIACDEQSRVEVTLFVRPPGITEMAVPIETWLDLTLRPDGFRPGTFLGAGPFAVGEPGTTFVWRDLRILSRHYWRTNTLFLFFDNRLRWQTQVGGSFLTHDCNTLLRVP
jgi:hypothetical protein